MQKRFNLLGIVVGCMANLGGFIPSALAAESLSVNQNQSLTNLAPFHLILPDMPPATFQRPSETLEFTAQHQDQQKISHIRLQQYYQGILVFGGYVILHSPYSVKALVTEKNANKPIKMNGKVYRGLAKELGSPSKDFTAKAPAVLQQFKQQFKALAIQEESIKPIVYVDEAKKAHWAYQVSLLLVHPHAIPERPTAIISADSPHQIFVQWNDIKTAKSLVKARGFGGNEKIGQYLYGKDYPLLNILRDHNSRTCFMENEHVRVIDLKHGYISLHKPMRFLCPNGKLPNLFWTGYQGDGYDRDNGAYSPANDALHQGELIKKMYEDWYKIAVLTERNGQPKKLVMRVHYGEGYENAYWDGEQMTFGDGENFFYPLVSLSVSAHEISHGFTEEYSNLLYFDQSGGINEAFSDMAAKAVEYYLKGSIDSWAMGEDVVKGTGALRYMDTPSRDKHSIDFADQFTPFLDVHYSSGVFNRLFYLLSTKDGWDPHKAFDLMVKANMDYWTPYTNFEEGACGILQAAKDLDYFAEDVKNALGEVHISYKNCASILS